MRKAVFCRQGMEPFDFFEYIKGIEQKNVLD